ncbi:MAG: methionine synthase [Clostridia bacterium]|nr:methionine synthase [Clostridia bacterium]
MDIDKKEVLRYLGYKDTTPDEKTEALIDLCINEICLSASPKTVYAVFELDGMQLKNTVITLEGKDIKNHLSGCSRCVLMAATLGADVERKIAQAQVCDITKALVLDACATAAIETVCDKLCDDIEKEIAPLKLTMRFSPGYGDFPLEMQKAVVLVLDAGRKIGLTLTPENIMIPRKSVTAVMGITEEKRNPKNCDTCNLKDTCTYRKEGTTCE